MNRAVSLYLDAFRFIAAFVVLFYHFAYERLSGGDLLWLRDTRVGSDAVVAFFVLSGFVVAFSASRPGETLRRYTVQRLSRLYSVVLPALIITVSADILGSYLSPAMYDGWWYQSSHGIIRLIVSGTFLNEIWFFSIRPFTNGPFWSLSYEFWYFALFGIAVYLRGAARVIGVICVLSIMGPKIALMLPIWIMGALTYRLSIRVDIPPTMGTILFFAPIAIYLALKTAGVDDAILTFTREQLGGQFVDEKLKFSDEFIISYLYGALVSIHFVGVISIANCIEPYLLVFQRTIRFWAGLTFSIYLYHYPLLHLSAAALGDVENNLLRGAFILISTIITIVILGIFTEGKKEEYRSFFARFIDVSKASENDKLRLKNGTEGT